MPEIAFGLGAFTHNSLPVSAQQLINGYVEQVKAKIIRENECALLVFEPAA